MTASEWIMLGQLIAMVLTGTIVWWYTIETKRLRETSSKQLDVLQEQLAVARAALEDERKELLRQSIPFFRWGGGGSSGTFLERDFYNEGGPVTNVSVHSSASLPVRVQPMDILRPNEKGYVRFESPAGIPSSFDFTVRYRTRLGKVGEQRVEVQSGKLTNID